MTLSVVVFHKFHTEHFMDLCLIINRLVEKPIAANYEAMKTTSNFLFMTFAICSSYFSDFWSGLESGLPWKILQVQEVFMVDRKGRTIAHVLKHHVPMDEVPFSCFLCNFRCQDKQILLKHIKPFRPHSKAVMTTGRKDHFTVLNMSSNQGT